MSGDLGCRGQNPSDLLENIIAEKYVGGEERKEMKNLRMLPCHFNLMFVLFTFESK